MTVTTRRTASSPAMAMLLAAALGVCSCEQAPDEAAEAPKPQIVITSAGDEMVLIPAGTFRMGSDRGPTDAQADEGPARDVRVDAFLMDRTEVTQAQYARVYTSNGSKWKGPTLPVESISWVQAATYCNERSEAEGLDPCYYGAEPIKCNFEAGGYRLPTEAEWEYACRAGATGRYSFGDDSGLLGQYAWYADNARKRTHPVRQKQPNAWGLYDMHGNVAEWCNDVYAADAYRNHAAANPRGPSPLVDDPELKEKRVMRGGAWNSSADGCVATRRFGESPGFADACFPSEARGLRCVRKATPKAPESQPAPSEVRDGTSNR